MALAFVILALDVCASGSMGWLSAEATFQRVPAAVIPRDTPKRGADKLLRIQMTEQCGGNSLGLCGNFISTLLAAAGPVSQGGR